MIAIRSGQARGHTQLPWLDSYHTFSFGAYYNANYIHFNKLRVLNEDYVKPSSGFTSHAHNNMEIISYVISGTLEHLDSLGNAAVLEAGTVQIMTAGSGIEHSEWNPSSTQMLHFLQMWVLPKQRDLLPSYKQLKFASSQEYDTLSLLASPDGRNGSLPFNQAVELFLGKLMNQQTLSYALRVKHTCWLQLVGGALEIEGQAITKGDGVAIMAIPIIKLKALAPAEFLLFDFH